MILDRQYKKPMLKVEIKYHIEGMIAILILIQSTLNNRYLTIDFNINDINTSILRINTNQSTSI
jgi:hypothetical protein